MPRPQSRHLINNYNLFLVVLSFVMSILASWVAIDLSARVHLQSRKSKRATWVAAGSGAMGIGIWSMHYIGMLALKMPMPVLYDWPTVVLSLIAALIASWIALRIVACDTLSWIKTAFGGSVMGLAIASMHYIGMAAMRMPSGLSYSWNLVAVSIIAAVLISMVGLRLAFGARESAFGWSGKKAISALVMGFAIPTVHYIGMASARLTVGRGRFSAEDLHHAVPVNDLGTTGIVFVSILIIGVVLLWAFVDHHVSTFESALDGSARSYTQLREHHERLQGAFRAGGFGVWECDPATGLFYVDAALRDLFGVAQDGQPIPRDVWRAKVHSEDVAGLDLRWAECLVSGNSYENEYRVIGTNQEIHRVRSIASLVRSREGSLLRVLGMTWDVTADRHREEEIRDQATTFRLTLNAIDDAVIATDNEMRIILMNPAAAKLTGRSFDGAVQCHIESVFRAEDEITGILRRNPIERCIEHGGTFLAEDGVLISQTGERYNIRKHVALLGSGRAAVITFRDITAARRQEKELLHAATHDALTNLANRTTFEKKVATLWEENRYSGRVHCVCIVDLDRFKIINDDSGHLAGDALLKELARLMKEQLRQADLVARMGGDEFMLLLPDTSTEQAMPLLGALLARIGAFRFPWKGKLYDLTASIGLVSLDCFSPDTQVLLGQADAAVFMAKRNGRNQVAIYVDKGSAADHLLEMHVASDLRRCLEEDYFELYAQPIVSVNSPEETRYFEVLLRMRGDDGKLIAPDGFIPAAERFGMMALVDRWVIRNALEILHRSGVAEAQVRLAINLSAASLSDSSLWDFVSEQFRLTGVDPADITFEVTETSIIDNLAIAKSFMRDSRSAGCRVALDDFGTGLSSLSYLKQFPLDTIKIDGSFITTIIRNPLDQAIVRAVGQIARSIGATTVAECVEDKETIQMLRELGVDWIQGWATGKPEPLRASLAKAVRQAESHHCDLNEDKGPFLVCRDVA